MDKIICINDCKSYDDDNPCHKGVLYYTYGSILNSGVDIGVFSQNSLIYYVGIYDKINFEILSKYREQRIKEILK